jgi:hypothetical protein
MFLDLPDPSLFVRMGSVSGSGLGSVSGSFLHQAEIVRKTLISSVL